MTKDELILAFETNSSENGQFHRIEYKRSRRPDLHAFSLLDSITHSKQNMIACAEHDEIWLDVSIDELARLATSELIIELVRCGVRFDSDTDSLAMFV